MDASTTTTRRNLVLDVLWALALAGAAAAGLRLRDGLGATTGLNDANPWGLWIAFKLVFVALAGGGFTLAGLVYVFHLERFRPLLRRAILLAFLGYGSFIVSLIFDLGLPWHIYMPVVHWQHHSVMFEIAWCVMLYFTVLIMEFSPVILEHPRMQHPLLQTIARLLHRLTLPVVILGIVLSTLHQSSLGALFLMMPHRVHPLWYSPLIPPLFFVSAIAAGLAALVLENFLAKHLFEVEVDHALLPVVGRLAGWSLWLYLVVRLWDLFQRGVLPSALAPDWQSALFLTEILLGGLLPAVMLSIRRLREDPRGLATACVLAIAGIVSQRMALSMFTLWRPENAPYHPTPNEVLIALGIPAAAGLLYFAFSQHLKVAAQRRQPGEQPPANGLLANGLELPSDDGLRAQIWRRSGIGVLAISAVLGFASPRSVSATPTSPSPGWEVIKLDANHNGDLVLFPHLAHQERIREAGSAQDCTTCHHLSNPGDEYSDCSDCHADAYQAVSFFDHHLHSATPGGAASCIDCHAGEHTRGSLYVACSDCHAGFPGETGEAPLAPAYMDALHGLCLGCHTESAETLGQPNLDDCVVCHAAVVEEE